MISHPIRKFLFSASPRGFKFKHFDVEKKKGKRERWQTAGWVDVLRKEKKTEVDFSGGNEWMNRMKDVEEEAVNYAKA